MLVLVVEESPPGDTTSWLVLPLRSKFLMISYDLSMHNANLYLVFDGTTNWIANFESFRCCSYQEETCPGRGQRWAGCGALNSQAKHDDRSNWSVGHSNTWNSQSFEV